MKYQGKENRNIRLLAVLTAIIMMLGVFSVFPAMATGFKSADVTVRAEAAAENEDLPGTAYPGYVVYDHNYIAENLSSDTTQNVSDPCWNHASIKHNATEGFVRLSVAVDGTTKDPYIAMELEKDGDGNGKYSASEYNYITVIARNNTSKTAKFELFYETDTSYNRWWKTAGGSVNCQSEHYVEISGWQVITFDFTKETGGLKSVRLDFLANNEFDNDDSVDIMAIILNKNGEAVYESSYSIMESIYNPVQILKDFSDEDKTFFSRGVSNTNTVSVSEGNIIYKPVYPYTDPYAGFKYDEYINSKNEGLEEDDPARLKLLTPKDFRYVVLKFRGTPGVVSGSMQLFVLTNDRGANGKHGPTGGFQGSDNYGWRTVCVDFSSAAKGEYAGVWDAEGTVFNGFRVDWAGNGAAGAFCELDEILFFNDANDAYNFSQGLNNIPAPSDYVAVDDGETYVPSSAGDTYSVYSANDLLTINSTATNGTFALANVDDIDVAGLLSDGEGAVSVALSGMDISANNYETVAFAVKAVGGADEKFDLALNYKTEFMSEMDREHKLVAQNVGEDGWQIVAFDLSDVTDWSGRIEQLTLECISESGSYTSGSGLYIYSAAFCFYPENAADFAEYVSEMINTPKQVISGFNSGDVGYFNQGAVGTQVSVSGGNLTYSASESISTSVFAKFLYNKYMIDSAKYKALTTEDFKYITIKYRAENVEAKMAIIELSILDKNNQPILINPDKENDHSCYASRKFKYTADGEWHLASIDMTNGGNNAPVWTGAFNGVRFNWSNKTSTDPASSLEISKILFFEDKDAASAYEALAANVVTVKGEDIKGEDDTLPDFPGGDNEETSSETLPDFSDSESEDTDSETMPSFPGGDEESSTETLPQIPDDSDESTSEGVGESTDESTSDRESDIESDDTSDEESTSEEESSTNEESTSNEESSTNEESDSEESTSDEESDSENENPPVVINPVNPDPNNGGDAGSEEGGSEAPFVIACVALGGLSAASIGTVVFIKIRMRFFIS